MTGEGGAAEPEGPGDVHVVDLASRALQVRSCCGPRGWGAVPAAGHQGYEERFGHVHLVRSAGRSGEQMPALVRERPGDGDATERDVVRDQLAEITSLRLRRLWEEGEV